jgi:hypothetical protein
VIQVWVIRGECADLAAKLEKALNENPAFKGSVICTDEGKRAELEKLAAAQKIEKTDLAILPAAKKESLMEQFKLSPEAKNTIHVYKNKKVASTFVNVSGDDFAKVVEAAKAL